MLTTLLTLALPPIANAQVSPAVLPANPRQVATASNTLTFDLARGAAFAVANNAHVISIAITGAAPRGPSSFTVQVTGSGKPYDWAWPAQVSWREGAVPVLPVQSGKIMLLAFDGIDGGGWRGRVAFDGSGRQPAAFKYVIDSATGDDGNDCRSLATPCRSWAGLVARNTLGAGDRICIVGGSVLREKFQLAASGTLQAPIVIDRCPGSTQPWSVYGSERISAATGGWRSVAGTKYSIASALPPPRPGGRHPCIVLVKTGDNSRRPVCTGIDGTSARVTVTAAAPAVVTWTAHGMNNGNAVSFTTTGTLPAGVSASTRYYVVNRTADTFQLAATPNGAAISATGSQSGTHTATSALGVDQFRLAGGTFLVDIGEAPGTQHQFEVGQRHCFEANGVAHWRFAGGECLYAGHYGLAIGTAGDVDDLTVENFRFGWSAGDNINLYGRGNATGIWLRGIYSGYAMLDGPGGGGGDLFSAHASPGASSLVIEHSTFEHGGKDAADAAGNSDSVVRYNRFHHGSAGMTTGAGGNTLGWGDGGSNNGSLDFYGNVIVGDGSARDWRQGQYAFKIAFTGSDSFTLRAVCNVFYTPSITNSTSRAVALWGGANAASVWKNNIVLGPWQIGLYWRNGPPTAGIDYNTVYGAGTAYSGMSKPPDDLAVDPNLADVANGNFMPTARTPNGTAVPGLTVAMPKRGADGCAL